MIDRVDYDLNRYYEEQSENDLFLDRMMDLARDYAHELSQMCPRDYLKALLASGVSWDAYIDPEYDCDAWVNFIDPVTSLFDEYSEGIGSIATAGEEFLIYEYAREFMSIALKEILES